MTGLVLDVLPGGRKVWRCHYDRVENGRRVRRKVKLGDHCTSLAAVRKRWQEIRDTVDAGRDYLAEKKEETRKAEMVRRRRRTFRDLGTLFVNEYSKAKKRTWREDEYKLGKYVYPVIGDMLMEEITRDDIKGRLLGSIARPMEDAQGNPMADEHGRPVLAGAVQADRVRALVSTVFNWARQEKGVSVVNPAALIGNLAVGGERQAVDEASVARLWPVLSRATNNITTWRAWAVARMAFLSGKRLQEISGARKSELDLDGTLPIWTLGGGRSGRKNSKPHSVPLPPMLRELFREAIRRSDHPTLVFPSEVTDGPIHKRTVSDRLTDAYAECNIMGVDFHSIRHTVETQLAKIGISDETRDRILDHGKKMKKSEGYRYNHYDYYQPKYAGLERLEKHLDQIIKAKQTGAEIVALETASA